MKKHLKQLIDLKHRLEKLKILYNESLQIRTSIGVSENNYSERTLNRYMEIKNAIGSKKLYTSIFNYIVGLI